ncbi:MAG: pilin [Candidatus Berkelbacteria bacterium]|nr:pilin [Candidatus Berkelbacteria bacterium]
MIKILFKLSLTIIPIFLFTSTVFAADSTQYKVSSETKTYLATASSSVSSPLEITDFTKGKLDNLGGGKGWAFGLFVSVITWLLGAAGAFAVIAIVYSGIMYIMSAGNQEQVEKAKKNITWAVTGLVFIAISISMLYWIYKAFTGQDLPP